MRTTLETLQLLGFAAAAVGWTGRVLFANELFKTDDVPWSSRHGDVISLQDGAASERLNQTLSLIATERSIQSIPLRHSSGVVRHVMHVLPVRDAEPENRDGPVAIVAITSASFKGGSLPLLQSLFDLTPAEAALAQRIGMGHSVEDIAQSHGRSVHTLRSQLKSVLAKAGCSRQAELAYILTSLVPPTN